MNASLGGKSDWVSCKHSPSHVRLRPRLRRLWSPLRLCPNLHRKPKIFQGSTKLILEGLPFKILFYLIQVELKFKAFYFT